MKNILNACQALQSQYSKANEDISVEATVGLEDELTTYGNWFYKNPINNMGV